MIVIIEIKLENIIGGSRQEEASERKRIHKRMVVWQILWIRSFNTSTIPFCIIFFCSCVLNFLEDLVARILCVT
jgi:hypothetical protein